MRDNHKIKLQIQIVLFTSIIFVLKLLAWILTDSVAVFTDAMESTVNITTSLFGLYAVWLATRPRDKNYPYGHGKIEFIAAIIEGTLICFAAFIILYQAILHFKEPSLIHDIDIGTIILASTAVFNFIGSRYWLKQSKKHLSPTIEATAKHLQMDAVSSTGIIVALLLIKFTQLSILDPIVGVLFALYILYEGILILKKSIAGIMDEANFELLEPLIKHIEKNRKSEWIDLHNLRMIQYGNTLHIDAHITVPYYYTVEEAHDLVEEFYKVVEACDAHQYQYEFFLHLDPCQDFSCRICTIMDCPVRKHPFEKQITWNLENVLENQKHDLGSKEIGKEDKEE